MLVENAAIARTLVELFAARFDPVRAAGASIAEELRHRIVDGCDAVPRLDHDRILRGFLALVDATLRTNRYLRRRRDGAGAHLALKFDSAAVPDVPRPSPTGRSSCTARRWRASTSAGDRWRGAASGGASGPTTTAARSSA